MERTITSTTYAIVVEKQDSKLGVERRLVYTIMGGDRLLGLLSRDLSGTSAQDLVFTLKS